MLLNKCYNKTGLEKNCSFNSKLGFTLLELLVVVAIIAVVGLFASYSITASRQKSHDTARISALRSLSAAIDLYRSDAYGKIPQAVSSLEVSLGTLQAIHGSFLDGSVPTDPDSSRTGESSYVYCSNSDRTKYLLMAKLEKLEAGANGTLTGGLSGYASGSCVSESGAIGDLSGFISRSVCGQKNATNQDVYCLGNL